VDTQSLNGVFWNEFYLIYVQFLVSDVVISLTMIGTINWGLEAVNFCHIKFFFMFREKPMGWS